jgi:uncharacterized membrane protein YedE/YeeE
VASFLENPLPTFILIIFGAYVAAILSGEFSVKLPLTFEPLVMSFAGGFIAGVGAVIARMSVHSTILFNLAGVFTLPAFMITKGWIYIAFMVLGGAIGSKLLVLVTLKIGRNKREIVLPEAFRSGNNQRVAFYILSTFFLISILLILLLTRSGQDKAGLILAMVLLALFGFVAERGTVCMSSMLKEWFISHSAYVWRSVLFTIMCLALFYQVGLQLDLYAPIVVDKVVSDPGLLVAGSFLLGFGFIFADGCFIGSLWKAGQGNVVNVVGLFGLIIGLGGADFVKTTMGISSPVSTAGFIPNYLNSFMSPVLFLVILWIAGLLLLFLFRQSRYRY